MAADVRWPTAALAFAALFASSISASAQSAHRDGIAELISKSAREGKTEKVAETTLPPAKPAMVGPPAPGTPQAAPSAAAPVEPKDPREGEAAYEQARQLMLAVDAILQDTAEQRTQAQKLPGRDEFILTPLWTETREDREVAHPQPARLCPRHRHRRADRRDAEEGRGPAPEHPRDRSQHRHAEGKADHGAEGRHAAGRAQRHGVEPRQQHQGCRAAHRQEPGRDRQDQDGDRRRAGQVGRRADAGSGGPAARQRAVGRSRAPRRRVQCREGHRHAARQAAHRRRRQHELGAQVLRHARGAVRHAGARARARPSRRSTPTTCRSSTPS